MALTNLFSIASKKRNNTQILMQKNSDGRLIPINLVTTAINFYQKVKNMTLHISGTSLNLLIIPHLWQHVSGERLMCSTTRCQTKNKEDLSPVATRVTVNTYSELSSAPMESGYSQSVVKIKLWSNGRLKSEQRVDLLCLARQIFKCNCF